MTNHSNSAPYDYEFGIIGAGFGGLGAAIKLQQSGHNSFVILESADEVGGTWRENTYPGCACDIASHLYSYSFKLNPNWSTTYAEQPEILDYLRACRDDYQLGPHIRYGQRIQEVVFDAETLTWLLTSATGDSWRVKMVVAALGPLHIPKTPDLLGRDVFEGPQIHTAQWPKNLDLQGKRVGVVGTGASAIQLVPRLAKEVADLTVFQRTAPWIFPKKNKYTRRLAQGLYRQLPMAQRFVRNGWYWYQEVTGKGLFNDNFMRRLTQKAAENHLQHQIKDPKLQEKVRPNYTVGCKRRLPSDDYYPALTQEHVHLITEGIERLTPKGWMDKKGKEHALDVLVYATGFHVSDFRKRGMRVIGKNGVELFEHWSTQGAEAHYGTTIAHYPGFFFILGPNTGLGHNSVVHMMESQFNYLLSYLEALEQHPEGALLDVDAKAQADHNHELQAALSGMVWTDGSCSSWYLDERGKNSAMWPGPTMTYRRQTKQINPEEYTALIPEQSSQS